ncbi:MAG: right-handed parallel beta-helix repeat-containing protein [Acidobacteriota bacterium]|nr:right-handed parallel beta-helix repeat-containing protein [Acidobacteriota bacterium]
MKTVYAVLFLLFTTNLFGQCVFSCPTADEIAVQAELNATAAAGGGTVQIRKRVLNVCRPLAIGSNTHLRGVMRGATVVRAVSGFAGRYVSNTALTSVIGTVGTNNVTISDLTADIFTCGVHANVIELLPASTVKGAMDGTVVTNATVERVEILGAPGYHSYMIWNLKGRHIRYLNNWIDGNSARASTGGKNQEGMESFGGYDVLMQGNTVKNIGAACVTLGAGNIVNSDTNGLRVVDNYLSNCTVGINLTASGVFKGESTAHTLIRGNVIVDIRQAGIDVPVDPGAYVRDLQIIGNTIRNVTLPLASGIVLRSNGDVIGPQSVIGTVVAENHVQSVTGANSFGIFLSNYPGARVLNNTIIGTASDGIRVHNSSDTEVVRNRITAAGNTGVGVYRTGTRASARVMVEGNRINDWSPLTSGVLVLGTSRGTVKNNVFARSDTAVPSPVTVTSESCGFTVSGNEPWHLTSWPGIIVPPCP